MHSRRLTPGGSVVETTKRDLIAMGANKYCFSPITAKLALTKKLAADTLTFLEGGGKIEVLQSGLQSIDYGVANKRTKQLRL
tara:strand:- start:1304 stop:1549 length:246 start_codon:yes stop_codon:yes gene_type:complete